MCLTECVKSRRRLQSKMAYNVNQMQSLHQIYTLIDAVLITSCMRYPISKPRKTLLVALAMIIALFYLLLPWPNQKYWFPTFNSPSKLGIFRKAAISTDAAPCAFIGRQIFERNGSAVDVAISVLVCMGAVNPQSLGLGGGFLMLVYTKEINKIAFINAREVAPLSSSKNMFSGNATASLRGGLSIAVPGELAGYSVVHKRFGVLPWKELFQPTIKLCRTGITVTAHLAAMLEKYRDAIIKNAGLRNIFVDKNTGDFYNKGDTMLRIDLANTLEIISRDGINALYDEKHEMARRFLQDLESFGSIITKKDMTQYRPKHSVPVKMILRNNWTLYSSPPPGSGALLASALSILDCFGMTKDITKSKADTILTFHRIIETFKFTYAKRMEMTDDVTEMRELLRKLTSKDYSRAIHSKIDDKKTHDPKHYDLKTFWKGDHGTSHLSIVAPNGDAVSVTSTINFYFGSHCVSPSTGIILNDQMDDFSSPNIINNFGIEPSLCNQIKPGKSPFSSMCPSIFLDSSGDVRLVIGGNGGTKIISNVLLAIIRSMMLGDNLKIAIDGPRLHHQLVPNIIHYEEGFPEDILDELRKLGHETAKSNERDGIVMGIVRSGNGKLYANADYRKEGAVDGF